jgi:hypothetical protein
LGSREEKKEESRKKKTILNGNIQWSIVTKMITQLSNQISCSS